MTPCSRSYSQFTPAIRFAGAKLKLKETLGPSPSSVRWQSSGERSALCDTAFTVILSLKKKPLLRPPKMNSF